MVGIFLLLGLGLAAAFVSTSGDDDAVAVEETDLPEQSFTDGDDRVYDESHRDAVTRTLMDYVDSGEMSGPEADDILQTAFLDGPFNVVTGDGDDSVLGSAGDDRIDAGADADVVHGGLGDDVVQLGDGTDTYGVDDRAGRFPDDVRPFPLSNEFGIDEAVLEGGDDFVRGGAGDDDIADGYGSNTLLGNEGQDLLIAIDQDGLSPDSVSGGYGQDSIFVDQGDRVTTGAGDDRVSVDIVSGVTDGYQAVTITDFVLGQDRVELEGWDGLMDGDSDPVTVTDSDDGLAAVIAVNGIPVVEVIGGQGLTRADVSVSG